ncbi:MAG: hypothetical protein JSS27_08925 [Planctomycetes bacterium]|nr:hypothetical protein [Planctomycetota bacterium]
MRLHRLTLYVGVSVLAVIALAMWAIGAALYSAVQIRESLEAASAREMHRVFVEQDLALALLEQRGLVTTYVLDNGNPRWLDELEKGRARLADQIALAGQLAGEDEQAVHLQRLRAKYEECDRQRREVVRLFQAGQIQEARRTSTEEVTRLFRETAAELRLLTESSQRSLQAANSEAQQYVSRIATLTMIAVALIVAICILILFLLYSQLLQPLRAMVREANALPSSFGEYGAPDEIRALGRHLRTLMNDVAAAKSDLVHKNSRLLQAEKLASVGRLASSVAHEIKNPLTAIKMWLFSIKKSVAETPDLDRKFEIVSGEITRLEGIVNNFLTFSRPPAAHIAPLQISQLLDQTLQLIGPQCHDHGVRIEVEIRGALPVVQGDLGQMKQVLVNLLLNAVEASEADTIVRITAECEPANGRRETVVIRIQDQGRGIPPDLQERIFEPFFTTREQGTGLGLCIASQILLNHGGWLELERSDNRGSTFAMWIPTEAVAAYEHSPRR